MVRLAEGDESIVKYLSHVANNYKCAVGLILGQIVAQKYVAIHLAKTPPFQCENDKNEDKSIKEINKLTEVEESWVADHARQTTKMLSGGMYILGIFIVSDEDVFNPFNQKIKLIINLINKTLSTSIYLNGNVDCEKLVIHYLPKNQRLFAKTFNGTTFYVQPVDLKIGQKSNNNKMINFECTYQIDHIYYLKHDDSSGSLRKHFKVILNEIDKNLNSSMILFDNDLKDHEEKIENNFKKKKVPRGSSNKSTENDEINIKPIEVSIFSKCILAQENKIKVSKVAGQIRIIGEVVSKLWLNSKNDFGEAIKAIKQDIMRSLATRMEMHCESLTEEESGEAANSVHEPPRRVFITLPENNVMVSDYLFPGEGVEDTKTSLEELLDIKTGNHHLELLDIEGQADITQFYKATNAPETENGEFLTKLASDSNKFFYMLGLSIALLIVLISIIIHYYLKV